MEYPAFTAGGLRCEFEHGMRAIEFTLRLARGAGDTFPGQIAVHCLAQRDIFLQRDVRKWHFSDLTG